MATHWLGIAEDITLEGVVGESHGGRLGSARAWLKPGVCIIAIMIVLISWLPTARMIYDRNTTVALARNIGPVLKKASATGISATAIRNPQRAVSTTNPVVEPSIIDSGPKPDESPKPSGRRAHHDQSAPSGVESPIVASDASIAPDINIEHFRQLEEKL